MRKIDSRPGCVVDENGIAYESERFDFVVAGTSARVTARASAHAAFLA
jgi:hypothetical protein